MFCQEWKQKIDSDQFDLINEDASEVSTKVETTTLNQMTRTISKMITKHNYKELGFVMPVELK